MAYHFRNLKQTIRIIPNTKSIGFSTRVNEGDQRKNQHADGSPINNAHLDGTSVRVQCATGSNLTTVSLDEGSSRNSISETFNVLRSPSDSELLYSLQPFLQVRTLSLPVAYKDIVQVKLPKVLDDFSEANDPILSVSKYVRFTSDDILVHHSFSDTNTTYSTREQIPIDVLTQHHYHRLAYDTVPSSQDNSTQMFSTVNISEPLTQVYYSADSGANSKQKGNNSKNGPTPEQMYKAKEKLEQLVIHLFKGNHNFEMLHKQVVLENNLFGENNISVGTTGYKFELLKLRIRVRTRLFSTSMEILSVTTLEQTGVIRIHWRLKGLPQIQNLKFWRLFQSEQTISKDDWEWLEAFSYFHIGKDGLVHKHRIDRMMPDDNQPDLTEKLRGLLNPAKPLVN